VKLNPTAKAQRAAVVLVCISIASGVEGLGHMRRGRDNDRLVNVVIVFILHPLEKKPRLRISGKMNFLSSFRN
jgi:hypothetical protein